ncbi:tetratricopeptide repeat protein 39C-like [Euwallacea fornicatus]|uniref:tetratricopeptide repeat protein 39C-like n=1 Tax=Euwallacea fornicatus TaxID=995702 RepID=UPI0033906FBC
MASFTDSPIFEKAEDDGATKKNQGTKEPEWITARGGINLLVNNNHTESEELFLQYPDSLVMYAGYSFTVFMDALMSFEDEKLTKAILILREVEKRCTTQNGWFKSISQKVFGSSSDSAASQSLAEQLEAQIILADSQVCLAILTFLQQDLSGYFKGGWVLRKAWKVYQRTYKEILTLYRERIGELHLPDPITTPLSPAADLEEDWEVPEHELNGYPSSASSRLPHSHSLNFNPKGNSLAEPSLNNNTKKANRPTNLSLKKSVSITESLSSRRRGFSRLSLSNTLSLSNITFSIRDIFPISGQSHTEIIDKKTIMRLMGAISFGYGLFQLGVSLLPPSFTRLMSILGFAANRHTGIACLMYARLGIDMRAPLASLALLWYHTIVRPFYAIDGVNVQAGVEAAMVLINESKKEFANSALFLFFAGRTHRLNSDIPTALQSFQMATDNANHREIKILCFHEIGWCHLIELEYQEAMGTFVYLKQASRWSRCFYVYMTAICCGSVGNFSNYAIFDELRKMSGTSRSGQLDEFLTRRLKCCPKDSEDAKNFSDVFFKLFVFEMLYLWNALASCSLENIDVVVSECLKVTSAKDEPKKGMANLILGSCYGIQQQYKEAANCFRKCLDQRTNEPGNAEDAHISAFAQYELGNILIQHSETKEEGKCQLQQINKYSRYDFEARLNVRVLSMLRHLGSKLSNEHLQILPEVYNEESYLINDRHSDRLSTASSSCFKEPSVDSSFECEDQTYCKHTITHCLNKQLRPMDFVGPPCDQKIRIKWVKNGAIMMIIAIITWYGHHVWTQFSILKDDAKSLDGRISDVVEARLDTLYQLDEISSMVKELRQNQEIFKVTIKKMIQQEMNKIYSDKTGRTDFALESAGGRIIQLTQGTENYGQAKSCLLDIPLYEGMHGPRAMIQSGTSPGQCWAFKGSIGGVIIKLLGPTEIDAISMEHISKAISPSGDSKTAPKDFIAWGMKSMTNTGTLLGQFIYDIEGPLVQTFTVSNPTHEIYEFIELKVMSNYGHPDFTCVYRFRVHGVMRMATDQ